MDDSHISDAVRELEKVLGFADTGPATYGRMCSLRVAAKEKRFALDLAIQQADITSRVWQEDLIRGQTATK